MPQPLRQPILRRLDQLVIASLTAVALAGAVVYWLGQGGATGGLVEIDRAPPLGYQFLVDINRADWPELAQLPGLGETLARRIVDSRENQGAYRSVEELQRVRGIGPRKLEAMRRYLLPMVGDTQMVKGNTSVHVLSNSEG